MPDYYKDSYKYFCEDPNWKQDAYISDHRTNHNHKNIEEIGNNLTDYYGIKSTGLRYMSEI